MRIIIDIFQEAGVLFLIFQVNFVSTTLNS